MEELFNKLVDVHRQLDTAVFFFRGQNFTKAYAHSNAVIRLMNELAELLVQQGMMGEVEVLLPVLKEALEAMEMQDEMCLADIYEANMLPFIKELLQKVFAQMEGALTDCWGKNRKALRERYPALYRVLLECRDNTPDSYLLKWSSSGDLSLKVQVGEKYLSVCSEVNPWHEALVYNERMKENTDREYLVLGFGMGYHVQQLLWTGCRKITVLEHDLYQLAIALSYRNLQDVIRNERLEIIYCDGLKDYAKYLTDLRRETKCCIWYPSIKTIQEKELREVLENFWLENASVFEQGAMLDENFRCNTIRKDAEISCLKEKFVGKTMILAAGGPSLDDELENLKNRNTENTILVCVGKVAKKLLKAGVTPDYIVMIDAKPGTRWQIRDIEECGVPLIYLSTVASIVAEEYRGDKYITFQKGFAPAEEYAASAGYSLYETGGSVSTFAIDMGIHMGCEKIVCVGLDLGYPGGRSHASGVGHKIADTHNMRQVEGVGGKTIATSKTLDLYRRWIERRIAGEKKTEFINASKGARIHGMKEASLTQYLED